jgi:hypothetical protein
MGVNCGGISDRRLKAMKILGPLLELIAAIFRGRVAVGERKNTPEIRENAKALDEAKATDRSEALLRRATEGDQKAVEDPRKELGT